MEKEKIIVTYAQDGNSWPTVSSELLNRFPIDAEFTNPLRSEVNKARLDIEFKKYASDMFPKFMPGAVQHNLFFVHIFIVSTDDVDSYKSSSRKLIHDWLNVVANKKNQEWMIVYFAERTKGTRIFNMGSGASVYEKLKTDFNLKKDRFLHLKNETTSWDDLTSKIKQLCLSGISSQISQYEDDARRLEQQRLMPGWNYNQYFILKEALSFTFNLIGLFNEVLVQYDGLEATFHQTLAEQGAPWFSSFGAKEEGDDNPDVFDLSSKNFRERIIQNLISIYDFRLYLFSRQLYALNALQNPVDIFNRTKMFISSFSRTIQEYEESLSLHFRESWTFSLALSVIRHCDELLAISNLSSDAVLVYEGLKGDLFLLARYQLDKLGVSGKLLSHSLHFTQDLVNEQDPDESFDITTPDKSKILSSNERLNTALNSKTEFDDAYQDISLKCIRSYDICERFWSSLYLKTDLAFLYFIRQNYKKSTEFFSEVCFKYGEKGWNEIDSVLIERYAICQRQLKMNDDLIKCYLHLVLFPDHLELESHSFYLQQLTHCCLNSTKPFQVGECPVFSVDDVFAVENLGPSEPLVTKLHLKNNLPLEFQLETLSILFRGGEGAEMIFETSDIALPKGQYALDLSCARSNVVGDYIPTVLVMKFGLLEFHYQLDTFQKTCKFRIDESFDSISIAIEPYLDGNASLLFRTSLNVSLEETSILEITPLTGIAFKTIASVQATIKSPLSEVEASFPFERNLISLPVLEKGCVVKFSLGYYAVEANSIHHKFKVCWSTKNRTKVIYSTTLDTKISPPFSISSDILHNPSDTVALFKIEGNEIFQTRLVSFEVKSDCNIQPVLPEPNQLLFHNHPVSLAVLLDHQISESATLKLTVNYRQILKEIENFIQIRLKALLHMNEVDQAFDRLKRPVVKLATASVNTLDIFYYGAIKLRPIPLQILDGLFLLVSKLQKKKVQTAIESLNKELERVTEQDLRDETVPATKMTISKLIPPCNVLIKAKWLVERSSYISVGEFLQCTLKLESVLWKLDSAELEIWTSIQSEKISLAIGGKTKFRIIFKSQQSHDVNFIICPLQPGPLFLPKVSFNAEAKSGDSIYFDGPSEQTNITILPREESFRKCFSEFIS